MSCSCPSHDAPLPRVRFKRTATRRDVLRAALGGLGMAALGPVVRRLPEALGAPLGNKIFVLLYLDGGCDTLNSVIPDVPNYLGRRPTIGIPLANRLSLNGTSLYALHPSLANIRGLYNGAGQDVALIQRVGYPSENLSHFESKDIYAQAVRNSFASLTPPILESGWIARYADLYAPTPTGAISLGAGHPTAFMGGSSNPLQVGSLASFKFNSDGAFSNNDAYRKLKVQEILAGATTLGTPGEVRAGIDQAYQLSGQVQTALGNYTSGVTYPATAIGRRLRDVAALVQAGFDTRVFYTTQTSTSTGQGFDTHGDQGGTTGVHATLMADLDAAINAFALDMTAMSQWQNVVIAVYTEFGRRNYENLSLGTDHGAGLSVMLVGGGVNGGLYGPSITNTDLAGEYLTYAVDFRDIWREVVNDHLGANPGPVFPEAQPTSQTLGVV
jgi:uncharacterized protein (DUF1501 family)